MEQTQEILLFGETAQAAIIAGVNKVANAVGETMGPGGHFVVLAQGGKQPPIVTKDGVTVAQYIFLHNPVERLGAALIQQTSAKTVDDAGDGTTTATVLTAAIVNQPLDSNIREFRRGIDKAKDDVLEYLATMRRTEFDEDGLRSIALTSANGDEVIADHVAKLALEVGGTGIISVEQTEMNETRTIFEPGYKFDRGYPTTQFVNNPSTSKFEGEGGLVVVVNERVELFKHFHQLILHAREAKKYLIVIAPDFSQDFIRVSAENIARGNWLIPVKAPEFGERLIPSLEDICTYCDGDIFSMYDIQHGSTKRVGEVERAIVGNRSTILFNTTTEANVQERIKHLENLTEEAANPADKKKLQERIAQLTSGFANIRVGGITPAEIKERFDRYEDAVGACLAALRGGVLPGGGIALAKCMTEVLKGEAVNAEDPFTKGYRALICSLSTPAEKILTNANVDLNILYHALPLKGNMGVDATTGLVVDMFEKGIVDPYEVTVQALINAVSSAHMILSISCVIDNNL